MARNNQSTAQSTKPETPLSKNNRKFRVKETLTIPLLSVAHKGIITAQILGQMYIGDMEIGQFGENAGKPTLCKVLDLDDEKQGLLICNEIIKSSLERVDGGYIDKVFQFRAGEIREGKRYRDIEVLLMEEE